jgi:predicted Rossmann fold flavoprotein
MRQKNYDLVIVGSGPAGLIAAIESYRSSHKTIIIEKMPRPALKLRISGKGRCNITNDSDLEEFISRFGRSGRFLRHAFGEFFNTDLLHYFEKLGVNFKLERGGRYFPINDKAIDIVNALLDKIKYLNIPLYTNLEVIGINKLPDNRFNLSLHNYHAKKNQDYLISTHKVLLATGGQAYPKTGSTGIGYRLATQVGHLVTPVSPALVPLKTAGNIAKKLQGLSLKNVKVEVWCQGKKIDERFGEMLFTDSGVSGPIILSLSKKIVREMENEQNIGITIDLKPAVNPQMLDKRLLREINSHGKQNFSNFLKKLLPRKLIPVFLELLKIPDGQPLNQITSAQRKNLKKLLKGFPLKVSGHCSFDEAIITAGGIYINEINSRTMESKIVKGLYFAGEIIDIDADTGGFNLQAAFSTGWVAGRAIKSDKKNISGDSKNE